MFRGLLVPLEGTDTTSRSVIEKVRPLIADEVEVVVLHVFTEATLPSMLDRPEYGREILGEEFLAATFPTPPASSCVPARSHARWARCAPSKAPT